MTRARTGAWSLGLAALLLCACGPASEAASLRLGLDDAGTIVGIYGGTSAAGVDVELEWAMELGNAGTQNCPVAVYRWIEELPEPGITLPSHAEAQQDGWPQRWPEDDERGAVLIDSGVVDAGGTLVLGPRLIDETGGEIEALLGVAACPEAQLELKVRAEVGAALGVRAVAEALSIELWRVQ